MFVEKNVCENCDGGVGVISIMNIFVVNFLYLS